MKVVHDHQIFTLQKYGGISRYFSELIKSDISRNLSSVFISNNEYYKKNIKIYKFLSNIVFSKRLLRKIISILNYVFNYFYVNLVRHDILHPTYYFINYVKIKKKPIVITVYDMIHEKFPEFFKNDNTSDIKYKSIKKANRIIAISNQTKNDLIEIYKIDPQIIDVIYLASNLKKVNTDIYNLPKKYILFVGSRLNYKNFKTLAIAFKKVIENYPEFNLVCVGGGKFNKSEIENLKSLEILEYTFQYEVEDQHMHIFYEKAEMFIFPSLYEGFGIPILEAFECKCPVILSNSSCFPEIAKDGALYFDPASSDSLYETIKYLFGSMDKSVLVSKASKRLEDFSWEITRKKTLETYKKTIQLMK